MTYIVPGTVALDWEPAIEVMMSEAAKEEDCLVDTAGDEVVVRCVKTSPASTERRRAVGRPTERALQEVALRR